METRVTVTAKCHDRRHRHTSTAYNIVYVGLDRVGRPSTVPNLQPETEEATTLR